jgi:hypothetical protein
MFTLTVLLELFAIDLPVLLIHHIGRQLTIFGATFQTHMYCSTSKRRRYQYFDATFSGLVQSAALLGTGVV